MLEKVKVLLGISGTTKDTLLLTLIDLVIQDAVNYTNNEDYWLFNNIIINMVIWKYNQIGSEGLSSQSVSGVSYSYSTEYPDFMLTQLQQFRKLKTL